MSCPILCSFHNFVCGVFTADVKSTYLTKADDDDDDDDDDDILFMLSNIMTYMQCTVL